jgi:hypothetical protein
MPEEEEMQLQRQETEDEELQLQRQELEEEEPQELAMLQREAAPEEDELQLQRQEVPEEEEMQLQRQTLEEEDPEQMAMTQRQPQDFTHGGPVDSHIEAQINQSRGGGRPMEDSIRQPMEQAFGADFSDVRIHTDAQAHNLNEAIQARAFATGKDIYFKQGQYSPTNASHELIAHELTHILQQGGKVRRQEGEKTADNKKSRSKRENIVELIKQKYDQYIQEASGMFQISPNIIIAIIATESAGKPNASNGSAYGLMQLTEKTWEDTQKKYPQLSSYDFQSWVNPRVNILMGTGALGLKMRSIGVKEDIESTPELAIVAYNTGQGTVKTAIQNAINDGSKNPLEECLNAEYLKPALRKYRTPYLFYLTGKGQKRNSEAVNGIVQDPTSEAAIESAVDLKYREVSRYPRNIRKYLDIQKQENLSESQTKEPKDIFVRAINDQRQNIPGELMMSIDLSEFNKKDLYERLQLIRYTLGSLTESSEETYLLQQEEQRVMDAINSQPIETDEFEIDFDVDVFISPIDSYQRKHHIDNVSWYDPIVDSFGIDTVNTSIPATEKLGKAIRAHAKGFRIKRYTSSTNGRVYYSFSGAGGEILEIPGRRIAEVSFTDAKRMLQPSVKSMAQMVHLETAFISGAFSKSNVAFALLGNSVEYYIDPQKEFGVQYFEEVGEDILIGGVSSVIGAYAASLAAGGVLGATLGSAVPLVGTAVGLVAGISLSLAAEMTRNHVME